LNSIHIEFVTDIDNDEIKRLMKYNSGLDINRINPIIGDYICIDHAFKIYMKVVSRSWILINGSPSKIIIKLTDPLDNHDYKQTFLEFISFKRK